MGFLSHFKQCSELVRQIEERKKFKHKKEEEEEEPWWERQDRRRAQMNSNKKQDKIEKPVDKPLTIPQSSPSPIREEKVSRLGLFKKMSLFTKILFRLKNDILILKNFRFESSSFGSKMKKNVQRSKMSLNFKLEFFNIERTESSRIISRSVPGPKN